MSRTDAILCWPRTCDYPRWRAWLGRNRWRFRDVIVVFTELSGPMDYRDFVRHYLPDCTFLDSVTPSGRDWRDVAVNAALDVARGSRVAFLEQDVIVDPWPDDGTAAVLGWDAEDGRLFHPSALFAQRDLVDRTSRYFGPEPVDHFCAFGRELARLVQPQLIPRESIRHMQAVTQNHTLIDRGEREGLFHLDRFHVYLRECLAAGVALHPEWERRAREELAR